MKLTGRTALITGGGSGIGLELAERLVRAGNTVIVCGRSEAKLRAAQQRVPGLHVRVADVASEPGRVQLIADVVRDFPGFDLLVNNAGALHVMDLLRLDPAEALAQLRAEQATNFEGPVHLALLALPHFQTRPSATLVNVTTGYIYAASARTPAYSATKTALHAFTQALRLQLRGTAIGVVEVVPPPVVSDMSAHYQGAKLTPEVFAARLWRGLRAGRDEVRIGISAPLHWFARFAPRLALRAANPRSERFALPLKAG
ncbi:MAG: SDR family NAD(P)-dependent oxidoreductase [Kofleriaceae bacterium]